jgi:hypothetical protein
MSIAERKGREVMVFILFRFFQFFECYYVTAANIIAVIPPQRRQAFTKPLVPFGVSMG